MSSLPKEKLPEERLCIPGGGRGSCSKPEDKKLVEDDFFKNNPLLGHKHKMNDGDGNSMTISDYHDDDDEYDSEEDYCTKAGGKMDKHLWEKYYQQIQESQGFDIKDFPGRCWMTTVFPLPYYLDDADNVKRLEDFAGQALKLYNDRNGTDYEVENILKVNGGGCRDFIYYLTFSVKNGEEDIFQAKVVQGIDRHLEFPIVRPKVEATMG